MELLKAPFSTSLTCGPLKYTPEVLAAETRNFPPSAGVGVTVSLSTSVTYGEGVSVIRPPGVALTPGTEGSGLNFCAVSSQTMQE